MIVLNLTEDELEALTDGIEENMEHYENGESGWIRDYLVSKGYDPQNSRIFIKTIEFNTDEVEPADTDFDNAVALFEALDKDVAPYVASSGAFWTAMTHANMEYMAYRWPVDPDKEVEEKKEYIEEKYVMKWTTSRRERRHNGLSRLWWIAYLTVDETSDDIKKKYELTREIVGNQELFNQILDREAFNPLISKSLLMAIREERLAGTEVKRDEIRALTRYIFTMDRSIMIYSLSSDELVKRFREYLRWYRERSLTC